MVALYSSEDKKLLEVDSSNGANGPEPLSVIVNASSTYSIGALRELSISTIIGCPRL